VVHNFLSNLSWIALDPSSDSAQAGAMCIGLPFFLPWIASVKLLPFGHEVMGSSPENSLKERIGRPEGGVEWEPNKNS
jgi:hypothetical protein